MEEKGMLFSNDVEIYVLSALMLEPNYANEFCGRLTDDSFYNIKHKKIYKAIYNLYIHNEIIDITKVAEELKKSNLLDSIGGKKYLREIITSYPENYNINAYIDILEKYEIERALYNASQQICKNIVDGGKDFSDLLVDAEKSINDVVMRQRTSPLVSIEVATEETIKIIEANRAKSNGELIGINTGFDDLNKYTYGFQPGELIILAARPGIGKSTLALNIATNACELSNAHVAFFSLEMAIDQLVMRLLSSYSTVHLSKIRRGSLDGNDSMKLLTARKVLDGFHLYLDEALSSNLEDIKLKCRKYKREGKLDLIIIDYLQLISANNKNNASRYELVTYLSRNLKLLAMELGVPIIALSQLARPPRQSRTEESSQINKPLLSDLRESGSIEQDADIVLFLHRDSTEAEETKNNKNRKTEVIVAKNRQGMTGSFFLRFVGDTVRFVEMENKKE